MQSRVRVQRHGMTGCQVSQGNKAPPKRGRCGGWSAATVRRNTEFLRSVAYERLEGVGVPFTLTVRGCPESPEAWNRMRRSLIKRMERRGMLCLHWVTEWQARGVPHLHGCAYFPSSWAETSENLADLQGRIVSDWLEIAAAYGAAPRGQFVGVLWDALGWAQYVSKHAARGVRHYQRAPENMPAAWQGRTGRMWGYLGDWPTVPASDLELSAAGWYMLRRFVRAWRKADARAKGDRRRISQARRMLKHSDPQLSRLRGWSEWIPERASGQLLEVVAKSGHRIIN